MAEPARTMARLKWEDSLSTGVSLYDEQHQKLIRYVNELRDGMMGKNEGDAVEKTLVSLLDYTNTHFFDEEIELYKRDYPEYEKHKAEHDRFLWAVRGLYVRFKTGRANSRMIGAEILATA
ncbi:MAG: bacteriohemerythrin [Nitrospinae bacterium]|nr:bacteriohemerythrin [Nitrospinota bacterium]